MQVKFADYPWVARAIASRGGNYKFPPERFSARRLVEYQGRLIYAASQLELIADMLQKYGVEAVDLVGGDNIENAVNLVERTVGLIADQCSGYAIHYKTKQSFVTDEPGDAPKRKRGRPRKKPHDEA
jgi:hypothetical protein